MAWTHHRTKHGSDHRTQRNSNTALFLQGPEKLFTAQVSTQRLTPTCGLDPAPPSPLPAVPLPSRLCLGPGSWQSPLLVLHTTRLVSSHAPIAVYLISKRKQTHSIQPQKEGNSDTHHDINELLFPFCTFKSFADDFLICLQVLTWMNLEDIMLMKSARHRGHIPHESTYMKLLRSSKS